MSSFLRIFGRLIGCFLAYLAVKFTPATDLRTLIVYGNLFEAINADAEDDEDLKNARSSRH